MKQRTPHTIYLLAIFLGSLAISLLNGMKIAEAHADYDHSEPAANAVIPTVPTEVRVWFTQELFRREGANTLEVYQADGSRVDLEDARIDDDDRSLMLVSLASDLPWDTYTVKWQTLSSDDGHDGAGEFQFIVDPAAEQSSEQSTVDQEIQSPLTSQTEQTEVETETPPATSKNLACLNALVFGLVSLVWVGQGRQFRQFRQ